MALDEAGIDLDNPEHTPRAFVALEQVVPTTIDNNVRCGDEVCRRVAHIRNRRRECRKRHSDSIADSDDLPPSSPPLPLPLPPPPPVQKKKAKKRRGSSNVITYPARRHKRRKITKGESKEEEDEIDETEEEEEENEYIHLDVTDKEVGIEEEKDEDVCRLLLNKDAMATATETKTAISPAQHSALTQGNELDLEDDLAANPLWPNGEQFSQPGSALVGSPSIFDSSLFDE
jgi:hypothetical protein